MKLHVDQRFARVTLDRFVDTYFSEDFNDAVAPLAGLRSRTLVEERRLDDGTRERRVRMEPAVSLPPPIDRLVGRETISYDEVSRYQPAAQELGFHVESRAGERVAFAGVVRFHADGDGVRRVIDAELKIQAPLGLGAVVERFVLAETERGYLRFATFLQGWLDDRATHTVTSR